MTAFLHIEYFLNVTQALKLSKISVLVSYCCYNKLPQTTWLTTTQIYYLTVLEVRNPKIKMLLGQVASAGSLLLLCQVHIR